MNNTTKRWSCLALFGLLLQQSPVFAKDKTLGGAPILGDRDIAENLGNSMDHQTLVDALKSAGLLDSLKGPGPYTVFAPTNVAFDKLPTDSLDDLLKPEHQHTLVRILDYLIVEGRYDAAALTKMMRQNGDGKAQLTTVEGHKLSVSVSSGGHDLQVTDDKGTTAKITNVDVGVSNGIIQVIDRVMEP